MKQAPRVLTDTITAVLAIALVICFTSFFAAGVVESSVYRQSRIVTKLVQQEELDIGGILEDTRSIELLIKFAGALATAYINFEMIPLGEEATFAAIFESLDDDIEIDSFEYRRKDLLITGTTGTKADYERFLGALGEKGGFAYLEGSCYDSTDGVIKFEILCVSSAAEVILNF